jgi:hypothetical protein
MVIHSTMSFGLVIEVRGASQGPGMTIDVQPGNSSSASSAGYGRSQQWSFPTTDGTNIDGATGYINNINSGLCIETDGLAGDAVYQWPCNGSSRQRWQITSFQEWDWSDFGYWSHFHIVNPATQLALDMRYGSTTPGTAIVGYPLNGNNSDNQAWDIQRA